jgi:glycosidase
MIQKLLNALKTQGERRITIPKIWNANNLPILEDLGDQIVIDEGAYLIAFLKALQTPNKDFSKPLSFHTKDNQWLHQAITYSMMIRTSSAWDYDQSGQLEASENGTFIRTLFLLPYLRRMGINLLYLLPISKYSLENKKGELGSVYGVSNFFEFDPNLKHTTSLTIAEEFQCMVEAAHMMGMRVMIDLIPRTNSTNSELIADHPDWFYWIDAKEYANYYPPAVPTVGRVVQPSDDILPQIYASEAVQAHIKKFVPNPGTHPRWNQLKHDLAAVEAELGIRIAPAFSDHVNDQQPPWTDVTFFRLYMDHPTKALPFVDPSTPPYILFDTIKGNLYQGKHINEPLWDVLSSIIPFYQQFGVDGARIDMGHALPTDLTRRIVERAKALDPYFGFVAEETVKEKSASIKHDGYDMMIGNGFYALPRYQEGQTKSYYFGYKDNVIPVFANIETHDTKRAANREYGGKAYAMALTFVNYFMPNGIPFINSGQELLEIQPMNLGVDCGLDEQFVLPKDDPFHGNLALFDPYQFHYLNKEAIPFLDQLEQVAAIRLAYPTLFQAKHAHFIEYDDVVGFSYQDGTHRIEIVANLSTHRTSTVAPVDVIFSSQEYDLVLRPMEVKILRF